MTELRTKTFNSRRDNRPGRTDRHQAQAFFNGTDLGRKEAEELAASAPFQAKAVPSTRPNRWVVNVSRVMNDNEIKAVEKWLGIPYGSQYTPLVEPSLEVLRAAADAVDPFATEVVPETLRRKRDERVRRYVLKRAGGRSEYSGEEYPWGLRCHHVDAIGQDGPDTRFNVIALTPNEHGRADVDPDFNALVREKLEEVEPRD